MCVRAAMFEHGHIFHNVKNFVFELCLRSVMLILKKIWFIIMKTNVRSICLCLFTPPFLICICGLIVRFIKVLVGTSIFVL